MNSRSPRGERGLKSLELEQLLLLLVSLSSRRAWIEIIFGSGDYEFITVALLAESVD